MAAIGTEVARDFWAQEYRPGDKLLDFTGIPFHAASAATSHAFKNIGVILYCEDLQMWESGINLARMLDVNEMFAPVIPTRPIAEKLEREGKTLKDYLPHLKVVTQTGELAMPMKEYYFKVFSVPVTDIYGVSEAGFYGGSCIAQGDIGKFLHFPEDMFFIEVIEPRSGKTVPYCEFGELVFTNLFYESMAYVRWHSEDYARVKYDPCVCGYTHM